MLNISICDDKLIQRKYLMILIQEYETENDVRFNLYQFDSGETLLEKFNEDKEFFDLFFLDYYMKEMTGLETALYIRCYNTACHIVFATASDEANALMTASPLQILSKPVQKEDVEAILNKVLAWKASNSYRC
ncbi:MAG: histidine kinase [Desulfosporosinus sp. BRH_c37]|nr:MAG: histidine kinase [Desulfosporosinus sp. BRH_c37]